MRRIQGSADISARSAALGATVSAGLPLWLRLLAGRNTIAVTLGRRIWISDRFEGDAAALERLMRHELEHVRQMQLEGLIPFLYQYLREYLIHRADGLDPSAAYRAIAFEVAARAAETRRTPAGGQESPCTIDRRSNPQAQAR